MSRCLTDRGIDHVVLERGRVAERWRSERWDSLRLLTPNWQSRLPGFRYDGPDPDGYMSHARGRRTTSSGYARSFAAPVEEDTQRASRSSAPGRGYRVDDRPRHVARPERRDRHRPLRRAVRAAVRRRGSPPDVVQVVPTPLPQPARASRGRRAGRRGLGDRRPARRRDPRLGPAGDARRRPAHAPAARLPGAGHPVVARRAGHLRRDRRRSLRPRRLARASRRSSSSAGPIGRSLDLAVARAARGALVGRLHGVDGARSPSPTISSRTPRRPTSSSRACCSGSTVFAAAAGIATAVGPRSPSSRSGRRFAERPPRLDLRAEGIRTVVWATGFRRVYPWLKLPVLDARGEIRHDGGITPVPGLYVLGLHFLRRRKSSFIDGVGGTRARSPASRRSRLAAARSA